MRALPHDGKELGQVDPNLAVARFAGSHHGVLSRRQAMGCGLSPDALDRRIADGRLLPLHRGVYRHPAVAPTFQSRVLTGVLATQPRSWGSCGTAARLWSLDGFGCFDEVHVLVDRRRRVRVPSVVVHRPTGLVRSDTTRVGAVPVTSPGRTLIDLAAETRPDLLERALDDALRRELVRAPAMLKKVRALAPQGRRGIGLLRLLLEDRCEQPVKGRPLERRFLRLLRSARLPEPVCQHEIIDERGRFIGRVDFAYPHARLVIEVDGWTFHNSRDRWESDHVRRNRLHDAGWRTLGVTKRAMDRRPGDVVGLVRRALAQPFGVT